MKFNTDNAPDIRKYFSNTFVKFVGLHGKMPNGEDAGPANELIHSIESVDSQKIVGKRYKNGEGTPYTFHLYPEGKKPGPEVEFILPRKSYFNTKDGACFLFRVPARQYRRGICDDNTNIYLLNNKEFVKLGMQIDILEAYVDKKQWSNFSERAKSYALSPRMAVSTSALFVDQVRIAHVLYNEKRIKLAHGIFLDELMQTLVAHGQQDEYRIILPDDYTQNPKAMKKLSKKWALDSEHNIVDVE